MARTHSFEVEIGRRTTPSVQSADATTTRAVDADNVIQDLAAARRRLHPEAPVLWIPPSFATNPGGR